MCVLGRMGGDIKYGYEIFTTGRRGGRRGGGSLKRSGVYLDFHVLSPSLCSWFGPAYKIGEKMP